MLSQKHIAVRRAFVAISLLLFAPPAMALQVSINTPGTGAQIRADTIYNFSGSWSVVTGEPHMTKVGLYSMTENSDPNVGILECSVYANFDTTSDDGKGNVSGSFDDNNKALYSPDFTGQFFASADPEGSGGKYQVWSIEKQAWVHYYESRTVSAI